MKDNQNVISTPERLAYWYLRLNGFLTIENFVVHPDTGGNQRTDADLLAVRFGHRAENLVRPMRDDPICSECSAFANVIIAEVKTRECALNGPWTREGDENIHRVLAAMGCFDPDQIPVAAQSLYQSGSYRGEIAQVRIMAFGDRKADLSIPVEQVLFNEMITFIHKRLTDYTREKRSVGSWAADGQALQDALDTRPRDRAGFTQRIRQCFRLPVGEAQ
jgi:hypothetical protein